MTEYQILCQIKYLLTNRELIKRYGVDERVVKYIIKKVEEAKLEEEKRKEENR